MADLFGAGEETGSARRVWSVAELNEAIRAALQRAFPAAVWVRGEVQRLPADAARCKHVYFELHGTNPAGAAVAVPVALLAWDRDRYGLQRYLDGSDPDFRLADKMEVCLQCVVDFYPPYGKLQLRLVGLDPAFTLGRLEAQRRRTLAYLERHGLLERQRALTWPELPLRVGLVTAAGSAAERDFLTGLQASGHGFTVLRADSRMMGEAMVRQVPAALAALARAGVDVVVVTRGGGSRADLSWFDVQAVAEAVARCPVPVITAIGHQIDRSLCDVVAHASCKTPTAAAQLLVDRVAETAGRLEDAAAGVAARVRERLRDEHEALAAAGRRLRLGVDRRVRAGLLALVGYRGRVAAAVLPAVSRRRERLRGLDRRLVLASRTVPGRAAQRLVAATRRLAPERLLRPLAARQRSATILANRLEGAARRQIRRAALAVTALEDRRRLLDPARLLARGWSVTTTPDGRLVRSVARMTAGTIVHTRLADGRLESRVTAVAPDRPATNEESSP